MCRRGGDGAAKMKLEGARARRWRRTEVAACVRYSYDGAAGNAIALELRRCCGGARAAASRWRASGGERVVDEEQKWCDAMVCGAG
jgi:hypothetical protein